MDHHQWLDFAEHEYALFLSLLRSLDPDEWQAPTDCAGWSVRDIVAHVDFALDDSGRETLERFRAALRHTHIARDDRGKPAVGDAVLRERGE